MLKTRACSVSRSKGQRSENLRLQNLIRLQCPVHEKSTISPLILLSVTVMDSFQIIPPRKVRCHSDRDEKLLINGTTAGTTTTTTTTTETATTTMTEATKTTAANNKKRKRSDDSRSKWKITKIVSVTPLKYTPVTQSIPCLISLKCLAIMYHSTTVDVSLETICSL